MVSGTADFSRCMRYRYALTRSWDATKPDLLVVMLNPSTADALTDDPTIRRVRGFAERWGWGGVLVMNLFAERSRDPSVLRDTAPVDRENDERLRVALQAAATAGQNVLAAWGVHGGIWQRAFRVLHMVDHVHWTCLGKTKCGAPRHPLYVASRTDPEPYGPFKAPGGADRGAL